MRAQSALLVLAAVCLCLASPGIASAVEVKTLEIGQSAPPFKLPGVDDRTYTLDDFADARLLVVVFTCNHCPTAQAYEDRIIALHRAYKDRGVALVAISPNDALAVRLDELGYTDLGDSLADMKLRAKHRDFQFPYLYDGLTQAASLAYGVLATPHVYIFDAERKLRYNGRIDNSDIGEVTSRDAQNAIEALLAGKPVPVETTRVFGCSTKWSDKRQSAVDSLKKWDAEEAALDTIDEAGVKKLVAGEAGKLRLVNLWATWCQPCVEELPELVIMHRMYRKRDFELVTISLDVADDKPKALETLREHHVSARNYLYASTDRDKLAEALDPKWPGPLPYTLLIAPDGTIIYRRSGAIEPLELKQAIADHLGRTYASRKKN
jgi:peroxiredoxin